MTLYNLALEYLNGEMLLRDRIADLRKLLPELAGEEKEELQSRIRSLYEMAADAKQMGEYLSRYYDGGSNSEGLLRKDGFCIGD